MATSAGEKPAVLVLGGTGFIGRNLVKLLLDSGTCRTIRSVDKVFPEIAYLSAEHAACYKNPACAFVQGNLASPQSISKCFDLDGGRQFDYVFNCAAESKFGQEEAIYKEKTHDVCVKIAQEAAKRGVRKFVHLSTAQVYSAGKKPSREGSSLDPWTTLAKVHLATEESLRRIPGLPLVILRPATAYGPGDTSGLAPRIICAAVYKHLGEKMKFLWSGDLRINTVHVVDVARAMWHCATTVPAGSLYNLSDRADSSQESINKLLEQIFGISTGFYGSLVSNLTKVNFKGVTEEVNDKHLRPWSELCNKSGITTTPLTPYLDPELLYNNSLSIDGTAIEATGFRYQHPTPTVDLLRQAIAYHTAQRLFPTV